MQLLLLDEVAARPNVGQPDQQVLANNAASEVSVQFRRISVRARHGDPPAPRPRFRKQGTSGWAGMASEVFPLRSRNVLVEVDRLWKEGPEPSSQVLVASQEERAAAVPTDD